MILISQIYPDLNLTNFPTEIDSQKIYEDVGLDTISNMNLYYSYINNKQFYEANQLLVSDPRLQRCIVNALSMNTIEHKIIAMQRFYLSDFQKYIESAITFRGVWVPTTQYNKFSVVKYSSGIGQQEHTYMAIQTNIPIGTLPINTTYWVPWSIKGDKGESGSGLTARGGWKDNVPYYTYDSVSYNNSLWYTLEDNINQIPSLSSTVWYNFLNMTGMVVIDY